MKYIYYLLSLTFCISVKAQDQSPKIATIKAAFTAINTDTTYKVIKLDNDVLLEDHPDEVPDGGEELTGYFKEKEIKKIVYFLGISRGNYHYEYYFDKGKLCFVYETFNAFTETAKGLDLGQTHTIFEGRYYFDNNKLIATKEKGKSPGGAYAASELPDMAADHLDRLKKKR